MGGITMVGPAFEEGDSENPEGQVLTPERYTRLTSSAQGITKVTFSDIKDRSKGDFLSKGTAILQTTWFILQCVARHEQWLALTELELVTLGLASSNATTYVFWWHKPRVVQEPVRKYYKPEANAEERPIATRWCLRWESWCGGLCCRHHLQSLKSSKNLQQTSGNFFEIRAKLVPWLLFSACSLPLSFSCPPTASYFHFPFLLKILKTTPDSPEEPAIRNAASYCGSNCILPSLCYRLTTYIGRVAQKWLKKFLGRGSYVGFVTRWFQFFCLPPTSHAYSVLRPPLPCLPCYLWDLFVYVPVRLLLIAQHLYR